MNELVFSSEGWHFGDHAFYVCNALTNVIIPHGVAIIRGHAFSGCGNLTNLIISDSVATIEEWAFYDCKRLTTVVIPDSTQYIGSGAFAGTGLTKVELPAHTKIEEDTFMWITRRK